MRALWTLFRMMVVFFFVGAIAVVVSLFLFVGGLILLVLGRRPKFRVYTQRDFEQVFERPPMRDVTPKPMETLPGSNS